MFGQTRDQLPRTITSSLATWVHDNPLERSAVAKGVVVLRDTVREALLFGAQHELLTLDGRRLEANDAQTKKINTYLKASSDEVRECMRQALLDEAVSVDTIQAKMESCLSNVNRHLSDYAKQIDLEYSDSPLRLDPRALTIVADTPEPPITMRDIGSGENHVGYHIVGHLALHTWFTNRDRPVPAFLLLDQLAQAHFSPDTVPREGVTQEKIDADRKAVKRLFGLILDVVDSLQGKFQVIITDHPDFSDDERFQQALRERWRDGLKLVPEDWPRAP